MLEILWGVKTHSIFDVWSIEHFLTGISIGTAVILYNKKSLGKLFNNISDKIIHPKRINWLKYKYDIILVLFISFMWETIEHYLETGLAGSQVEYWFQGVEFWPNRIITDGGLVLLGYLFAKKFPIMVWPARIISLAWLITHIFIFPHSMYLHYLL